MAYYSYEKGKYGGPCGTIFPLFTQIVSSNPLDTDYQTYAPAGFLKCQGQILQANQYPELARIIGVGDQCIYKKPGTVLQNSVNGSGGTFQLPDLGSKYISSGSTSGTYTGLTATNPINGQVVDRAGVSVLLTAQSNVVEFNYTGSFRVPSRPLSFQGRIAVSGSGTTPTNTVDIGGFLAHGHYHTCRYYRHVTSRAGSNDVVVSGSWYSASIFCYRRGAISCSRANAGARHVNLQLRESGTETSTQHSHSGVFPTVTNSEPPSGGPSGTIPAVDISASGLTTTVNINTRNIFKMDDIAPKFILCEYLIKF